MRRTPDEEGPAPGPPPRESSPPLKADGTVSKGMIPKIENALRAVGQGVRSVTIRSSEALGDGSGTRITQTE